MVNDVVEFFFLTFIMIELSLNFEDYKTFEKLKFRRKLSPTLPHFWGSLNQNMSILDMFWCNMDIFQVCTYWENVKSFPLIEYSQNTGEKSGGEGWFPTSKGGGLVGSDGRCHPFPYSKTPQLRTN